MQAAGSQWPTTVSGWIDLVQGVGFFIGILAGVIFWYYSIRAQQKGIGARLSGVASTVDKHTEAIETLKVQVRDSASNQIGLQQHVGRVEQLALKTAEDVTELREVINKQLLEIIVRLTKFESKLDANTDTNKALDRFGENMVRAFSRRTNYNNQPSDG